MASKLIAHLELKISAREKHTDPLTDKTVTEYHSIIAPTNLLMDFAIKNYAHQVGALEVKTITPEEYESKTQIQS
tara:strand:+ start:246 stop:470 length:225 start_codon:yes stop_codon:yes gene_type:complete